MKIENIKNAKAHTRYVLADGSQVPGVTTVLGVLNKPALVPWANKLGLAGVDVSKYVDALAEVGQIAHYLILSHLRSEKPELSDYAPSQVDKAENSFLSFLEWSKQHELKPLLQETPLVSEILRFGGTPDFFGLVDGVHEVIDFKSGKAIYDEHICQIAAYEHLVSEKQNVLVDRLRILQIGRDESEGFSERVITEWSTPWLIFKHCLAIYNLKKDNDKRSIKRA